MAWNKIYLVLYTVEGRLAQSEHYYVEQCIPILRLTRVLSEFNVRDFSFKGQYFIFSSTYNCNPSLYRYLKCLKIY